ncbi:MAG: hypothetical protein H6883_14895 [Rhodobiaceae bacterium]|nr:hypothetical protein [Rhodobiaceae bacterium]MCC0057407.1 hypothetical protein [Rhodobiaceae bacterium]
MSDIETDGLLGFDQMAKLGTADIQSAGRLMSKIGGGESALPSLDVSALLGFDQMRNASSEAEDADLAKTARLLTKIGPELPGA